MKNPPHRDPPPPPIPVEATPTVAAAEDKKNEGSLPGDLAPVPA
jgi:hypothetical protein